MIAYFGNPVNIIFTYIHLYVHITHYYETYNYIQIDDSYVNYYLNM